MSPVTFSVSFSQSKDRLVSGATCSALHRLVRLLRPLLTSLAPSQRFTSLVCPKAKRGTSQGKSRDLRAICLSHLRPRLPSDIGLWVVWPPRPDAVASMRFLFVRPALCLQLPSDPVLRRRPCCSASGSHHQGPQRTFTSKSSAGYHPGLSALARPAPCLAHQIEPRPKSGRAFLRLQRRTGKPASSFETAFGLLKDEGSSTCRLAVRPHP